MPDAMNDVVVAVGIEVADARSPRAVVLDADRIGDFAELARALLEEERVAPDARASRRRGTTPATSSSTSCFSRSGPTISLMSECMSVMKMSRRPSLLKSNTLMPIAPHDVRGKTCRLFLTKRLAADVLVVLVVALHVQHVEIEPAVVVDVDRAGVAGPGDVDAGPMRLRDVDEAVAAFVVIQDARLGPLRLQVAGERVLERRRSTCSRRPRSCRSCTVRR